VEIGLLKRGTADPNSSDNNDLADWQYQGDTIEVRIPWMLLGFMDPSSRSVWDWPYVAQGFKPVPTGGIQVEPKLVTHGQEIANDGPPAVYQWSTWDVPAYRERLKAGYSILTNVLGVYAALQPRNQSPDPEAATSLAKRGTSPVRTMIPKDPRSAEWRRTHPR
jgi:hypothetical protein